MRRWVALLAAVVVAGCYQPAAGVPVAKVSPTVAAASPTPTSDESPPSPSPTLTATSSPTVVPTMTDLPLSTVSFSCRLPVYQSEARVVDEFLSLPGLTLTVDGYDGKYYDRAYSRWVPARREAVSPDGAHYVSIDAADNDFVLHVIAVATGKDAPIHIPFQAFNGQPYVLDYSADGVYLVNAFEHLLAGLWLVNPSTGQMRQVSKDIYPVLSAGSGIFWTQAVNPADPKPILTGTSLGYLPDEIDRVDLRTGTRTQWLYEPGKGVGVIGLDGRGLPLIVDEGVWPADPNARLLLVAQPNAATSIVSGVIVQSIGGGITDSHGTWLGGQAGVYLYTSSGKLLKVADRPAYASLANGCF